MSQTPVRGVKPCNKVTKKIPGSVYPLGLLVQSSTEAKAQAQRVVIFRVQVRKTVVAVADLGKDLQRRMPNDNITRTLPILFIKPVITVPSVGTGEIDPSNLLLHSLSRSFEGGVCAKSPVCRIRK